MSRAVVLFGPDRLEVRDVDVAAPGAHEVRVRMAAAGVCHTDLSVFERGGTGMMLPAVLGHEGAGVIEAIGDGVEHLAPGDHVILAVVPQCGRCDRCTGGQPTLCRQAMPVKSGRLLDGTTRITLDGAPVAQMSGLGTWNEDSVVGVDSVVKIDRDVPLAPAALLGCGVVTGFGAAVNTAALRRGERVAVIGCGGVGLAGVQGARIAGAERIIAIDVFESKLGVAKQMGATDVLNATAGDVVARVLELTDGDGVDASLDFVGSEASLREALAMTRRGGRCVVTGLAAAEWRIGVREFVLTGKSLLANYMGMSDFRADFAKLTRLYRDGQLLLDEMVSRTIGIDDYAEAFRAMTAGEVARSVITFAT